MLSSKKIGKILIVLILVLASVLIFIFIYNTFKDNFITAKCNCSEGFYCSNGECVSKCGDVICVENEKEFCCEDCIKELEPYPEALKLAFLESELSEDCKMQESEKLLLEHALFLFQYTSLEDIKNNISEISGWTYLLRALYYYNFSIEEKTQLFDIIFENSSLEEKERSYIIQVAHILKLEKEKLLPWSIKDYSKEEINQLLNGDKTEWGQSIISEEWYKLSLVALNLTKDLNQKEAVEKIVEWETRNFFHAYEDYGREVYGKGMTDLTIEELFRERVVSCHTASHILIAMLRAINIPSYEIHLKGHGVVFIPSLNLYVHGDYIADFAVEPSLLMTKEELESYANSERGYMKFWEESPYRFVELKREGNSLYISGAISDKVDTDFIINSLKEYNIVLEKGGIGWLNVKSDKIKIKELEEIY